MLISGNCTANAIGAGHQFGQIKQSITSETPEAIAAAIKASFVPSRLFVYYNERVMIGTVNEDSGAVLRDGLKSVAKEGVCPEDMWPYDISRFRQRPPEECYREALNHQVISYRAVPQNLEQMKGCLAEGYPFVFGFSVYESFESPAVAKTGIVPMPKMSESMLGGHAVIAVGYEDTKQWFIVRNSWGDTWGDKGYCYMPYAYLINPGLAADFWTIRLVEKDEQSPESPNPPGPPKPPRPQPCDCSLAFPMIKQFLDAAVVEINKGATTEEAIIEGLKAAQIYAARIARVKNRQG